jgi:hypothetical protein
MKSILSFISFLVVCSCQEHKRPPFYCLEVFVVDSNNNNLIGGQGHLNRYMIDSMYIDSQPLFDNNYAVRRPDSNYYFSFCAYRNQVIKYRLKYNSQESDSIRYVLGSTFIQVFQNNNIILDTSNLSSDNGINVHIIK